MHSGMKTLAAAALLSGAFATDVHGTSHVTATSSGSLCDTGSLQSPIDLHVCKKTIKEGDGINAGKEYNMPLERPEMELAYGSSTAELRKVCYDDGCTLHVTPKDATPTSNIVKVPGVGSYDLDHCVVRIPSEHTVHHNTYPMEIQCVHTMEGTDGRRKGIFSTLYEATGKASDFIGNLQASMPTDDTFPSVTEPGAFDFSKWIGTSGKTRYHSYKGSHTTEDCKEDADWYVMYDASGVNLDQINALKASMSKGWKPARHPQKLYGRHPDGCHHHEIEEGAAVPTSIGALSLALVALSLFARA